MFRNVWHYLIQTFDWPHRKKEKRREGKEEEDKKGSAKKTETLSTSNGKKQG